MVRYKNDHSTKTREAIIDAAGKLLREKGFAETSVGTVMKAVGLTHGGFYAHFADKTAMLSAAVDEAFVQSPKNFAKLAEMANARNDVGFIAQHYLSDSRVNDRATGCPAAALAGEIPRQELPVVERFEAGTLETVEALAKAPGLSNDDQPFAWAAMSMLVGGLELMRISTNQRQREIIRNQIIAALRSLSGTTAPTHQT
jgi:TetR/AcrR family transcriptional regulator, transcriptional repressor for nem operon